MNGIRMPANFDATIRLEESAPVMAADRAKGCWGEEKAIQGKERNDFGYQLWTCLAPFKQSRILL